MLPRVVLFVVLLIGVMVTLRRLLTPSERPTGRGSR